MIADRPSVSVFAPAPILSIDIEPGAEHPEVHVHAGGQGPWIANMLAVLDTHVLLCTPLGGEIGMVLSAALERQAFELRRVDTEGTSGCIVEDRRSGSRQGVADMPPGVLNRHESDELCNRMLAAGLDSGVTVLTGPSGKPTIDPDVYRRIASDLTSRGVAGKGLAGCRADSWRGSGPRADGRPPGGPVVRSRSRCAWARPQARST